MMKVAIFIDDFSATGVVTNAIAIGTRLQTKGHVVQLVAAQAKGPLKDQVPAGISIVGLLPEGKNDPSRHIRMRRSVFAFRQCLKTFAPDVLFSAGNHGHLVSVLVSLAQSDCRTVVRISNDLDHMINGSPVKPFSRWWRVSKFRVVAALADQMVFVSRHMLRSRAVMGTNTVCNAAVIPNGVNVDTVRRRAAEPCPHPWLAATSEVPLVLGVGRLALQKNFVNLLRAVAIARRSRPVRLLLIGSGPLQGELQREAARLGIAEAVDIIRPVSNPMPYLARASVVALPSWWEGSSNVLLEALACGTPVVASQTAGNAEDILDFGRYGLLIDPDDVDGLASALLVQCGPEAQVPGDRALEFSCEAMLDAYVKLVEGQSVS